MQCTHACQPGSAAPARHMREGVVTKKHRATKKHHGGAKHGHVKHKHHAHVVGTHHKHVKAAPPKKGG